MRRAPRWVFFAVGIIALVASWVAYLALTTAPYEECQLLKSAFAKNTKNQAIISELDRKCWGWEYDY